LGKPLIRASNFWIDKPLTQLGNTRARQDASRTHCFQVGWHDGISIHLLSYHILEYFISMSFNFFSENDKFGDPSHTTLGAAGPAPPPPTDNYRRSFRWAGQYAPPDENPALNARSTASQVPISHLKISPTQRKRIEEMYHPVTTASFATPPLIDCTYTLDDTSQLEAAGVMAQYIWVS
jgi:hypothetical protein